MTTLYSRFMGAVLLSFCKFGGRSGLPPAAETEFRRTRPFQSAALTLGTRGKLCSIPKDARSLHLLPVGRLSRNQESFYQVALAADDHAREAFEPFAFGDFGVRIAPNNPI